MKSVNIVVFDTETNGLDPEYCDILSIGWVKIELFEDETFNIIEHVEYFIKNKQIHNTETCLRINEITDDYRDEYGIPIDEAIDKFKQAINKSNVYAYNTPFDFGFVSKYSDDVFDNAYGLYDIMDSEMEGVICCIQRISFEYNKAFNLKPPIRNHLHTAYDDVFAELLILLHDKFNINVRKYMVEVPEYEPMITVFPHQHMSLSNLLKYDSYLNQFLNRTTKFDEYLRNYVKTTIK